MIGTDPDPDLTARFARAGGNGRPRDAELTVCRGPSERAARPLAPPSMHFEAVAQLVTEESVTESVIRGPDPERHLAATAKYAEAGYDHVCVHQVGPDQAGFMRFYEREVFPRLGTRASAAWRPALPGKPYRLSARVRAVRSPSRDLPWARGRAQKLLRGRRRRQTWTWRVDA